MFVGDTVFNMLFKSYWLPNQFVRSSHLNPLFFSTHLQSWNNPLKRQSDSSLQFGWLVTFRHTNNMTSLLPVLLLLLLPQTILSQSGHYIPLGHGRCHDASFHHYPSLRRVHSPEQEEYLNILSLPHSSGSDISSSSHSSTNEIEETIQQINQITNCPIK